MPLYEYRCLKCQKRFEALVYGKEKPACPKCRGSRLEKLFSAFAVSGADRKSDSDDFGGGADFGEDFGGGGDGGDDPGDGPEMDASGGCGSCGDPRGPGSCAVN
jgi:putative FmdB family regulatory protein